MVLLYYFLIISRYIFLKELLVFSPNFVFNSSKFKKKVFERSLKYFFSSIYFHFNKDKPNISPLKKKYKTHHRLTDLFPFHPSTISIIISALFHRYSKMTVFHKYIRYIPVSSSIDFAISYASFSLFLLLMISYINLITNINPEFPSI